MTGGFNRQTPNRGRWVQAVCCQHRCILVDLQGRLGLWTCSRLEGLIHIKKVLIHCKQWVQAAEKNERMHHLLACLCYHGTLFCLSHSQYIICIYDIYIYIYQCRETTCSSSVVFLTNESAWIHFNLVAI